ncbi:hypothetical protein FEMY_16710 [Ferrovum myxofaciens]|uniref:Putative Flp pilus-assembly TadG-like N-terminal domain-containing protein n=1 Tax=Ferrovum myxofaciens TaxID=416213 RepID=A0A149VXB3_9PROT|nr:pilus assembly protein TadG-related protein [Ferrovum myxofaciens]KXW57818.1 hypothetical protein FEMY_16710 [Ferrovum myxofaciens]
MNKFLGISASSRVSLLSKQRGAVSIAAALSMTALMGVGAMAVDVGNVMVARNDVQNAADAAALRGAGLLYSQPGSSSPDFSVANSSRGEAVWTTADLNTPIEKQDTLTVNANYWKSLNSSAPSNDAAVRVTYTKRVNLFFAGILGMNSMNVTATSTAIVQNQNSSGLGAGGTHLPIAIPQCAINQYWDSNNNQPRTDQIQIGPTHTCSGGNGNQENQGNQQENQGNQQENQGNQQENQGNQQDNQQQQQDNQQQQNNSENSASFLRFTNAQHGTRHAAPLMNYVVNNQPHLVRMAYALPASALQFQGYRSGFVRVTNSGADRNGSANTVQGTGQGAGGPGNGNGPGQGAGQGLGADAHVGASVNTGDTSAGVSVNIGIGSGQSSGNSCITGQFTPLTSQPDNSIFSHSEQVAQNGNPEDLHVRDQIDLENGDYSSSQGNQGSQGNSGDQHHSQRESRQHLAQSRSLIGLIRAGHLPASVNSTGFSRLQLSIPSSGLLRVDQQGNGNQNQGNDNNQNQGNDNNQGNQQDGGDPYTTINNCSAAGNHSCEYSIVPVVDSATPGPHGKQTIVGFACLHVLSAVNGTINATLSMGCISNSSASVNMASSSSSSSSSSTQTSYGVVSPPRLAQ